MAQGAAEVKHVAVLPDDTINQRITSALTFLQHVDYYQLASAQFNEAAAIAEVRVKSRNYEPLCANLQSQILNCYQENPQLTLKCSGFAKEYRHCIREAQKMLLVNHG
ncbi:hypothetical protein chiPu_0014053 [Chiloscyllium punctatum]|uniref:CHCH domain-containing protein n=1 Tax=Chiloscyllium punctatum TaxID=137246 RepID=A0A401SYU8_CHIPU|nr:hypothetical protein [Chiloscyllium punctatum]